MQNTSHDDLNQARIEAEVIFDEKMILKNIGGNQTQNNPEKPIFHHNFDCWKTVSQTLFSMYDGTYWKRGSSSLFLGFCSGAGDYYWQKDKSISEILDFQQYTAKKVCVGDFTTTEIQQINKALEEQKPHCRWTKQLSKAWLRA